MTICSPPEETQSFFSQTLKTVRRTPGFEGSPPEDGPAVLLDDLGGRLNLVFALHTARARHHDYLFRPHYQAATGVRQNHLSPVRLEQAAGELVGGCDFDDLTDFFSNSISRVSTI